MKGGLGTCAYRQGDLMVGAVMACNAMGDVVEDGTILAGARNDDNTGSSSTASASGTFSAASWWGRIPSSAVW